MEISPRNSLSVRNSERSEEAGRCTAEDRTGWVGGCYGTVVTVVSVPPLREAPRAATREDECTAVDPRRDSLVCGWSPDIQPEEDGVIRSP